MGVEELRFEVERLRAELEGYKARERAGLDLNRPMATPGGERKGGAGSGGPSGSPGLAHPDGFRGWRSRRSLEKASADSLQLEHYFYKQGVMARPSWASKRGGEVRLAPKRESGSPVKWPFGFGRGSQSKVVNDEAMVEHYRKVSLLGEVLARCRELCWKQGMLTPLTERFEGVTIPRATLKAVDEILSLSNKPVTLRVVKNYTGQEDWADVEFDTIWANKAGLSHWGLQDLEKLIEFSDKRGVKKARFVHRILEACNQMALEDLDAQPTRHMYYHYGSEAGVKKEASVLILQVTPLLIEVDKKVYFGLMYEHDAAQKYHREVMDTVTRSHAVFRYTETALTIFTSCGIMLQQNPLSCTLFGIVASENTMYSDFDKEGKPVNRLMALFGDSHRLYEDMWDTVVNKSGVWSRRMRLGKQHLRPLDEQSLTSRSKLASDASEESSRLDRTEDSSKGIWFNVSFTKFNDPSDGTTAIFCEMKNIHKVVTQEQKLLAARKNEHDLLQSIIPKHIIEHLLEEKLEEKIAARREEASSLDSSTEGQRTPGSQRSDRSPSFSRSVSFVRNCSFSSDNSDRYLNIAAVRMKSDKRVRAMAEHQKDVTVFFADVVGFTQISAVSSPGDVMIMLNSLFTMFDDVTDFHDVYKVETIGDSYMCVTGLDMKQGSDTNLDPSLHANRMVTFAKDILGAARQVTTPDGETPVQVRVGLHSGDVVTGVVGHKMPRFCLFGDTVNVASRMESTGKPGLIHASSSTKDLVPEENWVSTGGVEAKGKGVLDTFLLECIKL